MNVFAEMLAKILLLLSLSKGTACIPVDMTVGMATLHNAMSTVLQAHPDRRCADCDGYIATVECDYGQRYMVTVEGAGDWQLASVADCLAPQHKESTPWRFLRLYGKPWVADIDKALWHRWGLPERPQVAILLRCAY